MNIDNTPGGVSDLGDNVIGLADWRALEIRTADSTERRFAGYHLDKKQWWISGPLQSWDTVSWQGTTRSGAKYQLMGLPPSPDLDLEDFLDCWMEAKGIRFGEVFLFDRDFYEPAPEDKWMEDPILNE